MRKLLFGAALSLFAKVALAACAITTNTLGTGFNYNFATSTFDVQVTKPTDNATGQVQFSTADIQDLTAGTFSVTNLTGETDIVEQDAPSSFQAAILWRAALTADGATVDYNNSNAANAKKGALVMQLTGCNTVTPIRAFGTPASGTSTAPQCPDTTSLTSGDLAVCCIHWFDNGDILTVTHPGGSWVSLASDLKPATANGIGIACSTLASAGGAPGTATWTLSSSRAWTAFTAGIAVASASTTVISPIGGGGGTAAHPVTLNFATPAANDSEFRTKATR